VTRPNRSDCATTFKKETSAKNARKRTNLTNQMQKEKKSKCLNYVTSSNVINAPTLTDPPKETFTSAKHLFNLSVFSSQHFLFLTFIDQKCTYEKVTKNWAKPSPTLFGQNPKEQQFFLGKPSLGVFTLLSPCVLRH